MKTLKMLGLAAIAVFMCASIASCSKDSNLQKSLEGTTWSAIFPDAEGWFELDFISETSVVLAGYDYDGTVLGRATGSYTYEYPIVSFFVTYDDWCNKFKTKVIDKKMLVTWVDEDIEIEIEEGLTFELK
jgi:hypothetical protein